MDVKARDPYASGQVQGKRDWPHVDLEARIVAVLRIHKETRGLQLIRPATRAICKHEIHELIVTDQADAEPGKRVDRIAYLAFAEFTKGGMLVEGDRVLLGGHEIGRVAGFDETHMPNHQNIVLKGPKCVSGLELGAKVGDPITIIASYTKG